jgi:FKBP-type peptidyl-prolyl cis-trans isomerase
MEAEEGPHTAGCLLQDFEQGTGSQPQDGQEVTFDYVAYNENGNRIDSSYNKGRPASVRLGINGLIPGQLYSHTD